jgi:nucleoside-diphosphate-sugar epimerase
MQNVLITGGAGFIGWRDVINGAHKAWIDRNCGLRIAI